MRKLSLLFISLSILFLGCNEVDNVIESNVSSGDCSTPTFMPNTNTKRYILVEDFTGHQCGNCPKAALVIKDLTASYGNQIIPISIHAGGFSETKPAGTGKYETNFRTEEGNSINSDFGIQFYPWGMVNRKNTSGTGIANWDAEVQSMLNDAPTANIQINIDYDNSSRKACIAVESELLTTISDDYNLVVALVEDKIIDWQKNYSGSDPNYNSPDEENYEHNHVLRGHINGTYGETIFTNANDVNSKEVKVYSYDLNANWNADNVHIIAYIINKSTEEVMQATQVHL